MNKVAVDTNVLIYLHEDPGSFKTQVAYGIIEKTPVISPQVVSEYLNVLKRLLKAPKLELIGHCLKVISVFELTGIRTETILKSKDLIQKYDFQIFDSIIVASALEANCAVLYSEDLQHNQLIENRLTIINPFL